MGGRGSSKSQNAGLPAHGSTVLREMVQRGDITAREFKSAQEGHDAMAKAYEPWGKGLTSAEKSAFNGYQVSSYSTVNDYLRKLEADKPTSETGAYYKDEINRLTSGLNKASVPEDMVVYRGISGKPGLMTEAQIKEIATTKEYYDGGFMSTSINSQLATGWASKPASYAYEGMGSDKGYHGTVLRIELPKGAKGAYMYSATGSTYGNEYEMLLQRSSRFTVTGYKLEDRPAYNDKVWVISMRWTGVRQSKFK